MARKRPAPSGAPDVVEIVARMRQRPSKGRGQRSPLYLWLRENHSRLAKEFSISAPSWPQLAVALAESGILNGDGKPPTAEGTRTVWYRVRQELIGAKKAGSAKPLPAVRSLEAPDGAGSEDAVQAEQPRRFAPVRVRGTTAEEAAPQPAPSTGTTRDRPAVDVDDVLSRFMPSASKRGQQS